MEYLARAIENVEKVVHLHVSDLNPIVRDQVVAEQTHIIQRAAIEDHIDNKDLAETEAGPKVRAAIKVVEQVDFSNALKFCQKPWWEASSTMLTSTQIETIEKSKLHGGLIRRLVNTQLQKIKNRGGQVLRGPLKKYSVIKNKPETVTKLVEKDQYKGLTAAQLTKVIDSYKRVIKGASAVERQTPNWAAAGRLLQVARQQLSRLEVERSSQVSRVVQSGTRDPPRSERVRIKAGWGLAKKPKTTPKRRKKRVKTPKSTPKKTTKREKSPKTALQKWNKHKNTTNKMRL